VLAPASVKLVVLSCVFGTWPYDPVTSSSTFNLSTAKLNCFVVQGGPIKSKPLTKWSKNRIKSY